jgi:hypothetical protein
MQMAIPSARTHGNNAHSSCALLAGLQAVPYLLCGTCFWLFSELISRGLGRSAAELIEFYGLIVVAEGCGRDVSRPDPFRAADAGAFRCDPDAAFDHGGAIFWFWMSGDTITAQRIAFVELTASVHDRSRRRPSLRTICAVGQARTRP